MVWSFSVTIWCTLLLVPVVSFHFPSRLIFITFFMAMCWWIRFVIAESTILQVSMTCFVKILCLQMCWSFDSSSSSPFVFFLVVHFVFNICLHSFCFVSPTVGLANELLYRYRLLFGFVVWLLFSRSCGLDFCLALFILSDYSVWCMMTFFGGFRF